MSNTAATKTITTKIAAPAWETNALGAAPVALYNASGCACIACRKPATVVSRRIGDDAGTFDVAWCSRECRIRECRIRQPEASKRQLRGRAHA